MYAWTISRRVATICCLLVCGSISSCTSRNAPAPRDKEQASSPPLDLSPAASSQSDPISAAVQGPIHFVDAAAKLGLQFRHHSPLSPKRHIHLFLGSGIGWLDFDRDGWPDLFCCQGASHTTIRQSTEQQPNQRQLLQAQPSRSASNALFHSQLGNRLADVTIPSGLTNLDYSMGMAAADYDNDGFVDLCVTGYGENFLYHNDGDGHFSQVELPRGKSPGRLSASCVWADIDADGNLDLFVTNYAKLGPDDYPTCEHTSAGITIPISCHPSQIEAMPDLLYRNRGDGTFEDISDSAGIGSVTPRAGLGVVAADLDLDGDIDFYVANDTTENHFWVNQGRGTFLDLGSEAGISRNRHGATEAGMGLVAGDITGRGRLDLFVTNYFSETNTLYRNDGKMLFVDVADELGLGAASRLHLGFGTSLSDFDNDGWLDLLVANGHVQDRLPDVGRNEPFAQRPLLFHSQQGRRFQDVAETAGDYLRTPHVARSTAVADFDRDGDPDVALNQLNDAAVLLQNDSSDLGNWLRIQLIGLESNRDGIGTILWLDLGDRIMVKAVQAGTGYLSSDESTILMGLGAREEEVRLTATWPSGRRETWNAIGVNRLWRLHEGTGQTTEATP